ncbi:SDR family oxidoreductase [Alkalihalobacillus pseudalcaliphilus]|uniref:SDR family oxidoreductase n=1 Tax=Alkalihalobacillus pseudalcaliphilus TaxID=79884 RepID=UPI00064DF97F|nr:SDR family oxidoreductase [Alkalihalobacillus pseudalcaliphilus]KMK76090.1 NAD-dependent dehydratase [Alkalihalobacillus pseudalcaliphilus]
MNVLVVGANGQVAKEAIKELKDTDHKTFAMIRNNEQAQSLKELGADEVVLADLEKDISHAFKHIDAVIFAAGSGGHTGADKTILIDLWGAIKVIDQAIEHKVNRFVMLSSMGTVEPEQSDKIKHYLVAKKLADDHLKRSELNYTIVRPGSLTNEESLGKIKLEQVIQNRDTTITRADVAKVLVATLDKENTFQQTFEILNGDTDIEEALNRI